MKHEPGRRAADALFATLALVALAPLFAAIALAIAIADGRPVLFRQQRLGRGFRPFLIRKFRTMRQPAAAEIRDGITSAGDPAITSLGRLLRCWKLDELPQFWNILRGDMSFFGPRPELPQYVAICQLSYRQLLTVRPGLLDPAAIQFFHEADLLPTGPVREKIYRLQILPQKAALSLAYLRCRTWRSDLRLVLALIAAACRHSPRTAPLYPHHAQPAPRAAR